MKCKMKEKNISRICKTCGTEFFVRWQCAKGRTCSTECAKKLRKQTNLEIYGHEVNIHGSQKEKIKKKLIEKYGVENVSQIPEVKQKKKDTCRKNFGVEWPMQSQIIRDKSKQTILDLYGVDNISKVPEIIKKIIIQKNTPSDKFNGLTPIEFGIQQIKNACLEKHGVEHYFETDEFKSKYTESMLEKYQVDNIFKSEYFNKLMIDKGIRYSDNEREARDEYYAKVMIHTKRSVRMYGNILSENLQPNIDYEIDHIYSKFAGFNDNVAPEIIGSIVNLQMIPSSINRAKKSACWIDKQTLLDNYRKLQSSGV